MTATTETLMNIALLIEKNEMSAEDVREFFDELIESIEDVEASVDSDTSAEAMCVYIRDYAKDLES